MNKDRDHEPLPKGVEMSGTKDLDALAEFAAGLDVNKLADPVRQSARACLLYGLSVGIATIRAATAKAAAASLDADSVSSGSSSRFLDGKPASRAGAAFANAVLLSGRVQGDSHPCGHLGGVVIPATLAVAQATNASGAKTLAALIAAYEVSLRIGRDHGLDLSSRGFRTTPCYGVFGASVGAGKLFGFDALKTVNAIRLAANFAGGLREYVDAATEESPFQAGFAARNGLHVADLIAAGVTAAPSALHGKNGFYVAFGERGVDYGRRMAEGLGEEFEFTTVTFKQYPACQWLRGLIRGMAILSKETGGGLPRDVEIRMNPFEADFVGIRHAGPFTSPTHTTMSAPFTAASGWVYGTATYAGLRNYNDQKVLALVPRIRIISDPSRRRYEPWLRVTTENGASFEWQDLGGQGDYQMSWDSALMMTEQLTAEVGVSDANRDNLIRAVKGVEQASDISAVVGAVCAATMQAKA